MIFNMKSSIVRAECNPDITSNFVMWYTDNQRTLFMQMYRYTTWNYSCNYNYLHKNQMQ